MYFDLTDEQKQLRDQLNSLLSDRCSPIQALARFNQPEAFDPALWSSLMEMGLGAILAPEDKGGLGMGLLTLAVVAESLGHYAAPGPVVANAIAAWLLAEVGGHDETVGKLVSGEQIAAFALSAETGWRPENWTVDAAGNGEVRSVESGDKADVFIVGVAGGGLALARRGDAGVTVEAVDTVDRTRPIARLRLEGAKLEPLTQDAALVERLWDALSIVTAADARGAAKRAMTMAVEYANQRVQFNRPIGQFQGLKYQLAEMAMQVEPAQPLVWYAAHTWDAMPAQTPRAAALAKSHVTDLAVSVGRACVEAHGGIGYTWEYPLHLWLKRAMHDRVMYAAPSTHRERAAVLAGW
ncbi:MAG: acyl-CoA dehydrogenase family protein [Phenylobacterium sp.]